VAEQLDVRTGFSEIVEVVEQFARAVEPGTIRLEAQGRVQPGDWVRFRILLADGSTVLEGVGRCAGSQPRGNPIDRREVALTELQFDERHEIMYERMLLARESLLGLADDTGTISLSDVEEIEDGATRTEVVISPPEPPAPDRTVPATDVKPGRPTKGKPAPPPSRPAPSPEPARRKSSPPAAEPARKRSSPPPAKKSPSPTDVEPTRIIAPPEEKRLVAASVAADTIDEETTAERARPARTEPSIATSELTARARVLARKLPKELLEKKQEGAEVEAVLRLALRLGLAALETLAENTRR
jgi:hypothetical protein